MPSREQRVYRPFRHIHAGTAESRSSGNAINMAQSQQERPDAGPDAPGGSSSTLRGLGQEPPAHPWGSHSRAEHLPAPPTVCQHVVMPARNAQRAGQFYHCLRRWRGSAIVAGEGDHRACYPKPGPRLLVFFRAENALY